MRIVEEPALVDVRQLRDLGIEVERDVALAPFTTIKIGGPADLLTTVTTVNQLEAVVLWARAVELPYFLLGGGSNMLIGDAGIRGLTIYNRCRRVDIGVTSHEAKDAEDAGILYAESGAAMAGAARKTVQHGYSGLEWAVSLPGTVGGAVVGNAGAYGAEVKDNLDEVRVIMDDGRLAHLSVEDLDYGYRSSSLKRMPPLKAAFKPVVLDARFRLAKEDANAVRTRADQYLAHRRRSQPVEPSLGSTFVNPPGDYAGRLIEAAGLKGTRVGGVLISDVHANFIVNPGGVGHARAAEVVELIEIVQARVKQEFGVDLVPEIQLAGEWSAV